MAKPTKMVPAAKKPAGKAAQARATGARPPVPSGAPSGPLLRGLTGPWLNRLFPIEGVLVLGRAPGCEVLLDDDSVSRRHAEVERSGAMVVLRDLGSANGTSVNGEPITEETVLHPGDLVQLGVVELAFEAPESGKGASLWGGAKLLRNRNLLLAGAALSGVLLSAWGVKLLFFPQTGKGADPPALDPTAKLNELLNECRSYSDPEVGKVDWGRAETACNQALDLDPIHPEAHHLLRKIRLERECEDYFQRGLKEKQRLREEEALEWFGKITRDCRYYVKVKPDVQETRERLMKKAAAECKEYVANGYWQSALPRCQLYMELACPNMDPEELEPPPGHLLITTPGKLKRNQWRPKDGMYLKFLQAREKADPEAPSWRCPAKEIMRGEDALPDPRADVKRYLTERFEDKELVRAMEQYHGGKLHDAAVTLAKIKENRSKAFHHARAEELRRDIALVAQSFKEGSNLQAESPERAAEPFREALRADEKLIGPELSRRMPSYYRRIISQEMAAACYAKGKELADRGDTRAGCRIWNLGFSFSQANLDLGKALIFCSNKLAMGELKEAKDCAALDKVLELAVEQDGIAEKVARKKEELGCP